MCFIFLSSCSVKRGEPAVIKEKKLSITISDLKATSLPTLEIAKYGDKFYKASPKLTLNIINTIIGTTPVPLDTPGGQEEDSSYNMKDYAYILRFSGHQDIMVYKNDNIFTFRNDRTKLYDYCWNLNYKLDLLKKEKINGVEMYTGYKSIDQFFTLAENDKKLTSYTTDLNGDGVKDTFGIGYDGDLSVKINGKKYLLSENLSYYGDNSKGFSGLSEPPGVEFLEGEGIGKLIVIRIFFAGADNFHVEQWTLKLGKDGKISIEDKKRFP